MTGSAPQSGMTAQSDLIVVPCGVRDRASRESACVLRRRQLRPTDFRCRWRPVPFAGSVAKRLRDPGAYERLALAANRWEMHCACTALESYPSAGPRTHGRVLTS
jgi:hypothetical protein